MLLTFLVVNRRNSSNNSIPKKIALIIKYNDGKFEITVPVDHTIKDVINLLRTQRKMPNDSIFYLTKENEDKALEPNSSLEKLGIKDKQVLELNEKFEITLRFFDTEVSISTTSDCVLEEVIDEFKKSRGYDRSIAMEVHKQNGHFPLKMRSTFQELGVTDGTTLEVNLI